MTQLFYRKVFALDRILSRDIGRLWGFNGGDKEWRNYIARYSYWECVIERAIELIPEVKEVPFDDNLTTIYTVFDHYQQKHLQHVFKDLPKLTPGMSKKKMSYLEPTARRFTYR